MSIYVVLGTPGAFDFKAFSDATRRSLALLSPLMELRHINSKVTNEIVAQVIAFGQAIQLGAKAAQKGFTATEDIIALAELVDQSTLEERVEYLNGTLELADSAYSEGKDAFDSLRDVRKKIFTLSDKFNSMIQKPKTKSLFKTKAQEEAAQRSFEELKKGIEVLESFGRQVSALAQWWDWVKVETDPRKGQKVVTFDDSSLKQPAVVDRWKLLRSQFADYTNMVGQLEDEYPELLSGNAVTYPPRQTKRPAKPSKNFRPDIRRAIKSRQVRRSPSPGRSKKGKSKETRESADQQAKNAGKSGAVKRGKERKGKAAKSAPKSAAGGSPTQTSESKEPSDGRGAKPGKTVGSNGSGDGVAPSSKVTEASGHDRQCCTVQ